MNILPKKKSGYWKPTFGAQIDWGHPLAIGMDSCLLFNEGAGGMSAGLGNVSQPYSDLCRKRKWTIGSYGVPPSVSGPWGTMAHCIPGTSYSMLPVPTFSRFLTGSWTIRMKARPSSTAIANANCVSWCCGVAGGNAGWIPGPHGIVEIYGGGWLYVSANTTLVANRWYDAVWVFDGTNETTYVNGRQDHAPLAYNVGSTPLNALFNIATSDYSPFSNDADLFMFWNRALSPAEVNWLWADPYAMVQPSGPRVKYFLGPQVKDTFNVSLKYLGS
jgi:hypothetical protein